MATISSTIKMMDRLTGPVIAMANAMRNLVTELEAADNKSINPEGMDQLKSNIARATAEARLLQEELLRAGQRTEENDPKQRQWNASISQGKNAMDGLMGKLKTALGLYALMNAGKKLINLSDEVTTIDARLNLIVDTKAQKENLKNAIYQSAQDARVPLNDFANSVAKLGQLAGDKFANNGEIIKFNNLMAKSFKISGASAQETAAAMYQLNQAMASGRLQGDEFRSIRENAPMLAQAIAKSMNVSMAELKKLGAEGKITADVIKNALFGMEGEINNSFKNMPMTWSDVWTKASNTAIRALNPLLVYINRLANSERMQGFVSGIVKALGVVGSITTAIFSGLAKVAAFMYDNWGFIEPVIYGVAAALLYYAAAQGIAALTTGTGVLAIIAKGIALAAQIIAEYAAIVATEGLAAAQTTLNAAVWAFPGTWIAAIIVGIIVVVIAAAIAIAKWATGTQTWAGVIVGALYWVGAVFYNILASIVLHVGTTLAAIWNGFAATANFVGNVMRDPASAFINYVKDMALRALDILKGFAGAVDKVIGTGFANTIEGWKGHVQGVATTLTNKYGNGQYKEIVQRKTAKDFGMDWDRKSAGGAFSKGRAVGGTWANGLGNLGDMFKIDPNNLGGGKDYDPSKGKDPDGVGKNTGKTADNTGKMADSLDDTEEEMKYLRELAEQEHINQFTTAEIKVEMNNENNISSGTDIDDMIRKLTEKLENAMHRTASGVYSK